MIIAPENRLCNLLALIARSCILLALSTSLAAAKTGPDRQYMNDCLVQIDGKAVIDGRCRVSIKLEAVENYETRQLTGLDGDGQRTYFVEIKIYQPDKGIAVWNGTSGKETANVQIGPVELVNRCWINKQVRLCTWDMGQPRSRIPLPDYPKAAPSLALPDFDIDAGCKYFGLHRSGTTLTSKDCLKIEQDSYSDLKTSWSDIPYSAKAQCLLRAMRFARMFGYDNRESFPNEALRTCISHYIDKVGIGQQDPP